MQDFPKVFPDNFKSLLSEREVEISIELINRAGPISKVQYRMAPLELAK
jgi:hypothetical protein